MIVLENQNIRLFNLVHHVFDVFCKTIALLSFFNNEGLLTLILFAQLHFELFVVSQGLFTNYATFELACAVFAYLDTITHDVYEHSL